MANFLTSCSNIYGGLLQQPDIKIVDLAFNQAFFIFSQLRVETVWGGMVEIVNLEYLAVLTPPSTDPS